MKCTILSNDNEVDVLHQIRGDIYDVDTPIIRTFTKNRETNTFELDNVNIGTLILRIGNLPVYNEENKHSIKIKKQIKWVAHDFNDKVSTTTLELKRKKNLYL